MYRFEGVKRCYGGVDRLLISQARSIDSPGMCWRGSDPRGCNKTVFRLGDPGS